MKTAIGIAFTLTLLFWQCFCLAQEDVTTRANALIHEGDASAATKLLEEHLKDSTGDFKARLLLGKILNYNGENTAALKILQQGLDEPVSDEAKIELLLVIANIELQLGEDGPYKEQVRGMEVFHPGRDEEKESQYKAEQLAQSVQTFEALLRLSPEQATALSGYSRALRLSGKHTKAISVLEKLQEKYPTNPGFGVPLAMTYMEAKETAKATKTLENYLINWPRNATALDMLAELYQAAGQSDQADDMRQKAEFYSRLPEFVKWEYSPENWKKLEELSEPAKIESLLKDNSLESSTLLAIYCWWHPHNTLENRAFAELGNRNDTTPLLEELFDNANSSCTIRGAVRQLARHKSAKLFDRLVELLPRDLMSMGYEMEIANAFEILGDPRAVEHLVKFLESDPKVEENGPPMLNSLPYAKARAILALGSFDIPESRRALEQLVTDETLGLCSVAALYRNTKDPKHLERLKKAVAEKDDGVAYPVYRLSEVLPEDAEIKSMLEQVRKDRARR